MLKPSIPKYEDKRQRILNELEILDTFPEQSLDDLTLIASQICDTPIALVSLVDNDRQWFKSKVGLNLKETSRDISFSGHAINEPNNFFIVENTKSDTRFLDNPLVIGEANIQFYAGFPLVDSSEIAIGTLCVIDQKPRTLTDNQIKSLQALAKLVMEKIQERKEHQSKGKDINPKNEEQNKNLSKYFNLYNEAPDMMISVDPVSKKVVGFNSVTCNVLGYSKNEIEGLEIFQLLHPDSLKQAHLVLKEFTKNGFTKNKRLVIQTKKGKKINVSVNIKAVKNNKGEIIYSNSTLRNIDDLIITENKIKELNNNLELKIQKRNQDLRFNKNRLELVLEGTKDCFLDWLDIFYESNSPR